MSTIFNPSQLRTTRRDMLADLGTGFAGIAAAAMLARDRSADAAPVASSPDGNPHFPPKVKSVIWLFMAGGVSQVETFDPKPELNKYADKPIGETPYAAELAESPHFESLRIRSDGLVKQTLAEKLAPMQVGWRKRGESGVAVGDWWEHVGDCVDDIAIVRSMWTSHNNHGAQLQFHNGRHFLDEYSPSLGAWVHYGLGSLNDNLPQFIVFGNPLGSCCGGVEGHGANYLGPSHAGVQIKLDPDGSLPFGAASKDLYREEQQKQNELLATLNGLAAEEHPDDPALQARIQSYELAFGMQTALPKIIRLDEETAATQAMYGVDREPTAEFGRQCLVARRLVEKGVRFVQLYHGAGGAGSWDAHANIRSNHETLCAQVDRPIAALLKDLKQRGMLDETLVVWGTEFGRTPTWEGTGRNHHSFGFSIWMAGGGIKKGVVHGATDALGFHAVEHRHYVTDVHATVLHLLGLDTRRLDLPRHKRLEIDYGEVMHDILV